MARFTPGLTGGEIRGSVAGITFCRGSTGPVLRSRSLGPARRTGQSTLAPQALSSASASWRELTDSQRLQWMERAAAGGVAGYRPDLSGYQLYCAVRAALSLVGQPAPTTPPVGAAPQLISFETPTQIGQTGSFNIAFQRQSSPAGLTVLRATAPLPPQLSRSRNPTFRLIRAYTAPGFAAVGAEWGLRWWPQLASYTGLQITWEARAVALTGQRGPILRRTTILS